jgi:hypothetical protein
VTTQRTAISNRDHALLSVLATKVKLLTFAQVHRTWWANCVSEESARRRLGRLQKSGLLQVGRLMAFPEVRLEGPLAVWDLGAPDPDLAGIIAKTRSRWSRSIQMVPVVSITPACAAMYGGRARQVRPSEGTHDIHLAQVFLQQLRDAPEDARAWVSEGQLAHEAGGAEGVIPDAMVRVGDQRRAVEVVGESYSISKLDRFCAHCRRHGWSYELW